MLLPSFGPLYHRLARLAKILDVAETLHATIGFRCKTLAENNESSPNVKLPNLLKP